MKNHAIEYLALDVHQATTVATVRDEGGSIRMRATIATEAGAIVGLVRGLGREFTSRSKRERRRGRSRTRE